MSDTRLKLWEGAPDTGPATTISRGVRTTDVTEVTGDLSSCWWVADLDPLDDLGRGEGDFLNHLSDVELVPFGHGWGLLESNQPGQNRHQRRRMPLRPRVKVSGGASARRWIVPAPQELLYATSQSPARADDRGAPSGESRSLWWGPQRLKDRSPPPPLHPPYFLRQGQMGSVVDELY